MKRLLSMILIIAALFALNACAGGKDPAGNGTTADNGSVTATDEGRPTEQTEKNTVKDETTKDNEKVTAPEDALAAQTELAQNAYTALNLVSECSIEIMNVVYDAWYYAIHTAEDDYAFGGEAYVVKQFSETTGIPEADVIEILDSFIESDLVDGWGYYEYVNDIGTSVDVVRMFCSDTYDDMEEALSYAKGWIKQIDSDNAEKLKAEKLQAYYVEAQKCFTFISELDCSFNQFKEAEAAYKESLRDYQSELSFTFDVN